MSTQQQATPRRPADDVGHDEARCELTLFVCGASELSARAISNARELCDSHLVGGYHLRVVDVHEDPAEVLSCGVLATPTLVKNWPRPVRKFVGDLSHTDRVLLSLDLPPAQDASQAASGARPAAAAADPAD